MTKKHKEETDDSVPNHDKSVTTNKTQPWFAEQNPVEWHGDVDETHDGKSDAHSPTTSYGAKTSNWQT